MVVEDLMKKIKICIFIVVTLVLGLGLPNIYGQENGKIEVSFNVDGYSQLDRSALDEISSANDGFIPLGIYLNSLTDKKEPLASLDFTIPFNDVFISQDGIEQIGGTSRNPLWNASSGQDAENAIVTIALSGDGDDSANNNLNVLLPIKVAEDPGLLIAILYLEYNSSSTLADFSLQPVYIDAKYNDTQLNDQVEYYAEGTIITPIIVGNPNSGPDASLKTLDVKGDSGTTYATYAEGVAVPTEIPVTISYQDSLKPLVITKTAVKGSSTEIVADPKPTGGYQTGDEIVIDRLDDTDTKQYRIIITVTSASTDNTLKSLTAVNNLGQVVSFEEGSFDPAHNSYTIKIPYSTESVTISGIKSDTLAVFSAIPKQVSFTASEKTETTKSETFTVTSESGISNTYTVNVVRAAADTDNQLKEIIVAGNNGATAKIATLVSTDTLRTTLDEKSDRFTFSAEALSSVAKVEYSLDGITFVTLNKGAQTAQSAIMAKGDQVSYTVRVTSESGDVSLYTLQIERPRSSNTDIDSVVIDRGNGTKTLTVADGRYTYTVEDSTATSFKVVITTKAGENAVANLLKDGNLIVDYNVMLSSLVKGENNYQIQVVPEDGSDARIYDLVINLLSDEKAIIDTRLEDNNQSFAKVVDFVLNGNTYAYAFSYSKASNVRLQIKSSDNSKITVNSGQTFVKNQASDSDGYVDLNFTNTTADFTYTVTVTVTAENGTTLNYTFTVKRSAADSDNKLSDLKVNGITITNFSSETTNYATTIVFARGTGSVTVEGIKSSALAKVQYKIGNSSPSDNGTISLTDGVKTEVGIIVTPESGASNSLTYTIYLIAASEENKILSMSLNGITMTPTFHEGTQTYQITVPYTISSTTVNVTASDYAKITGAGSWTLSNYGSDKNIRVVYAESESGKRGTEYTIEIIRNNPDTNDYLQTLEIKDKYGNVIFTADEATLRNAFSFNNSGKFYVVAQDVDYISVNATTSSTLARITSTLGNINLASAGVSENSIKVTVLSEAGTNPRTYEVIIKRGDDDTTFDGITIAGVTYGLTDFSNRILTITPNFSFDVNSVLVGISRNQTVAAIVSTGITFDTAFQATWNLSASTTTMTFRIKSQIGNEGEIYTVIANKNAAKKENNIAELEVIVGGVNLLDGQTIDFKTTTTIPLFRLDRNVGTVTIIVRILTSDLSSLKDRGVPTRVEGLYNVYEFQLSVTEGAKWSHDIVVLAQDASMNTNPRTYKLEFLSKNADITIEDMDITNHSFDFQSPNYTLGNFTVNDKQLTVTIVKQDEFSRIIYKGVTYGVGETIVTLTIDLEEGTAKTFSFDIRTDILSATEHRDYKTQSYTFTYNKAAASAKAELDTLTVTIEGVSYPITLTTGTLTYQLELNRSFVGKTATITATAKEFGIVGNSSITLKEQENVVSLTVTSQNGINQANYTLTIILKSNTAEVIDVKVKDLAFVFDATKTLSEVQLLSASAFAFSEFNNGQLEITITYNDQYATLKVNGQEITGRTSHTFTYTMLDSATLETIAFELISEDGKTAKAYSLGYRRNQALTLNELDDLEVTIDNVNFPIAFDSTVKTYEIKTERDSKVVGLNTTLDASKNATLTGNGTFNLVAGKENTYQIVVSAEDGTTNTYTVIIYAQSDDVDMLDITFDKLGKDTAGHEVTYAFDPQATQAFLLGQYTFSDKTIYIKVKKNDVYAVLWVDGSTQYNQDTDEITFAYTLKSGQHSIKMKLSSEYDQSQKVGIEYTFEYEQLIASNQAILKTLDVKVDGVAVTLDANGNILSAPYAKTINLRVDSHKAGTTLELLAAADLNATITRGGSVTQGLQAGLNTFTIEVLAENKIATGIYTINLYVANDSVDISGIKISGKDVSPTFSAQLTSYAIIDPFNWNTKQVDVQAILDADLNIVATGTGWKDISYGTNVLRITLQSEYRALIKDSSRNTTYEITIEKTNPYKDTYLSKLEVTDNDGNIYAFMGSNQVYTEGVYTYTIDLDKNMTFTGLNIEIGLKDARQGLVSISGNVEVGKQYYPLMSNPIKEVFKFRVVAEDGEEKEYTLNILQGTTIGTDNSIDSVVLRDLIGTSQYLTGSESFDKDKKNYVVTVGYAVTNIDLIVNTVDAKAKVIGAGSYTLSQSQTVITFYATAENGTVGDTYTITITRNAPSQDATLIDLIVKDKQGNELLSKDHATLTFIPATARYTLKLDRTYDELDVDAVSNHASAVLSGNLGNVFLNPGKNSISIYVTAEDGKTRRTYQVDVEVANSGIALNALSVDGYPFIDDSGQTVSYDKTIFTYNIGKIPSNVSSVQVLGQISDIYGSIAGIGVQTLLNGKQALSITLVSEDKETSLTYQIEYEKETGNSGTPVSDDASLVNLVIEGTKKTYHLGFDPLNQGVYKIDLDYEDNQLFLKATKHQRATIIGDGWQYLAEGETKLVTIQVTAEDGTKGLIYQVEFSRKTASTDNTLLDFYVEANGNIYPLDVNKTYQEVDVDPSTTAVTFGGTHPSFSKISGLGMQTLTSTTNIFPITVISQSGEVKTYNVNVKKANNNADLRDLIVSDEKTNQVLTLSPGFSPDTLTYNIDLTQDPSVFEIRIDAIAYGNAVIKGHGTHTLKGGTGATTDRYTVTVTAEDGKTTKTYTIIIERNIDPEDSILIDDLTLIGDTTKYLGSDVHPDALHKFTMSNTSYQITVAYRLSSIILSLSNKDGANIYGAGSYVLNQKVTTIEFYLVSKSGRVTSDKYVVVITKEDASTDNTLKSLTLNDTLIDGFDSTVFEYTKKVVLENYTTMDVKAVANDLKATVTGNTGMISISRGNNYITIRVVAEDGSEATYKVTINAASDLNRILDISVDNDQLSPVVFDETVMIYRLSVAFTTTSISLKAQASNYALISGTGIHSLAEGENRFYIYATSEYGTQGKMYEIVVSRALVSDDGTLKSLVVKNSNDESIISYTPSFDASITNYIINLPEGSTLTSVMIEAEANSAYAIVGGVGYKVLKADVNGDYQNVFEIVVRAQSGKTVTYTISIYRNVDLSDLTEYESLELKGSDGTVYLGTDSGVSKEIFSKSETIYSIEVPYHVSSVTLNAKALYGSVYGNETKIFGSSNELVFTSEIVSQSGNATLGKYTIRVFRKQAEANNQLTNLTIDGVQVPGFDPSVNVYEISIPVGSKTQVLLGATAASNTLITGTGVKELKLGKNVFTVNVTAQDGQINAYTITVDYVSNNALLETLEVKGTADEVFSKDKATDFLAPENFDPTILKHKIIVNSNTRKVQLTGTTQDQQGASVAGFLTYDFPLTELSKTVYVEVTSGTGERLVYEIELVRESKLDSNAELLDLIVGGKAFVFNPKTYAYTLNVDSNTKSLNLSAEAFSPNSKIVVRGYNEKETATSKVTLPIENLASGQNVIIVEVTAADGTQSFYTLTIVKEAPQDMLFLILLIASLLLWMITVLVILARRNKRKHDDSNQVIF